MQVLLNAYYLFFAFFATFAVKNAESGGHMVRPYAYLLFSMFPAFSAVKMLYRVNNCKLGGNILVWRTCGSAPCICLLPNHTP
ncbi:MAG: hypothetical protein C0391_09820 [Anaerolinea sp.]|nr:hypothetical protein [Anaerolinea sp.]